MMSLAEKQRQIWLIEDNSGDALLIAEALDQSAHNSQLVTFKSASDALRQLFSGIIQRPDLILLDMNLPKMNGIELLQKIRSTEGLEAIPVVVLTTSSSPGDVKSAYAHGANCFITKSFDANDFIRTILHVENFWFGHVSSKKP